MTRVCADTHLIQKGRSLRAKGVVKSKSPPQKRSSKVKAPFGFTRNRYPDVFYVIVQPLDEANDRWTNSGVD